MKNTQDRFKKRLSLYATKELLRIHQGKLDVAEMFRMARINLHVKIQTNRTL